MKKTKDTIFYIYKMRYFWVHLARSELMSKYRRSKLGMLWIMLSPMLLSLIMAIVLQAIMGVPVTKNIPYILSGMIVWDVITASVVTGGGSFFFAEQYIRQFNHPVMIYTLKSAVVTMTNFSISTIAFLIWVVISCPENILLGLFSYPLLVIFLFFISWSATTVAAFINIKYRDYPQMMTLAMQALWYISPVFFQESMFASSPLLTHIYIFNPITYILYLIRKPFLYGILPSIYDYLITLGCILVFYVWGLWLYRKNGRKIVFYL